MRPSIFPSAEAGRRVASILVRFALVALCCVGWISNALADDVARFRGAYARGIEAFDAGAYGKALEAFTEARGLSDRPEAVYMIGRCLHELTRWDEAITHYEAFLEEAPKHGGARKARLMLVRALHRTAEDLAAAGDAAGALARFDRALAVDEMARGAGLPGPLYPALLTGRGEALWRLGNKVDARRSLEAALAARPTPALEGRIRRSLALLATAPPAGGAPPGGTKDPWAAEGGTMLPEPDPADAPLDASMTEPLAESADAPLGVEPATPRKRGGLIALGWTGTILGAGGVTVAGWFGSSYLSGVRDMNELLASYPTEIVNGRTYVVLDVKVPSDEPFDLCRDADLLTASKREALTEVRTLCRTARARAVTAWAIFVPSVLVLATGIASIVLGKVLPAKTKEASGKKKKEKRKAAALRPRFLLLPDLSPAHVGAVMHVTY